MRKKYNLTKYVAVLSFFCILLVSAVSAAMLSRLFTNEILTRDAMVSKEFIESIVLAEGALSGFRGGRVDPDNSSLQAFLYHVTHIPGVLRTNVFDSKGSLLWSSEIANVGTELPYDEELDSALRGEWVVHTGVINEVSLTEYKNLNRTHLGSRYVETYIPIRASNQTSVLGVVELYKRPRWVQQSIERGQLLIWMSAFCGGALLFTALFSIVHRASRELESQHQRLVESESLSMIGETVAAVAHSMRNPLASIRASAELTLTDDLEGARESAEDIISETDRLDRWSRQLLQFSKSAEPELEWVDINEVISAIATEHEEEFVRSGIELDLRLADSLPLAYANVAPVSQVIENLIVNSVEAMSSGGRLTVYTVLSENKSQVVVTIRDTGPGLPEAVERDLFRPFITTKPTGTGLGLPLSRRLVEYYGGELTIASRPGRGVTASVCLTAKE